jgi:hypothetical protein
MYVQVTIVLLLIHTLYSTLQHALSLLSLLHLHRFSPCNGFQCCSILSFVFMSLLAGICLITNYQAGGWVTPTSSSSHCCLKTVTVKVKVMLRLTVSQSVSLGVEPHLGLMTRYLLLFDSYGLVFVGRPLWWEDGFVFCICCWRLPAQSFSDPSPLGLATIFYCLRFETSLFVTSCDLQGHGGGVNPTSTWVSLSQS